MYFRLKSIYTSFNKIWKNFLQHFMIFIQLYYPFRYNKSFRLVTF